MGNKKQTIIRIVAIVIAVILVQTLYFKFTAAPESVHIFKTVGLEPFGRIGIGVLELIAALLLLIKRTTIYGAILSISLISGAIFLHLTKLGIEVMNDGGLLFCLALIVFILSLLIVILKKRRDFKCAKK